MGELIPEDAEETSLFLGDNTGLLQAAGGRVLLVPLDRDSLDDAGDREDESSLLFLRTLELISAVISRDGMYL